AREARRPLQARGGLAGLPQRVGVPHRIAAVARMSLHTLGAPSAPRREHGAWDGGGRWGWWEWWLERKDVWVRDAESQLDADVFRTITTGVGLPAIHQRSNFAFRSVRDGAVRRPPPRPRASLRAHLHAPGQPDHGVPRADHAAARGPPRRGEGAGRGRGRAHHRIAHLRLGHGRDLHAAALARAYRRRRAA